MSRGSTTIIMPAGTGPIPELGDIWTDDASGTTGYVEGVARHPDGRTIVKLKGTKDDGASYQQDAQLAASHMIDATEALLGNTTAVQELCDELREIAGLAKA